MQLIRYRAGGGAPQVGVLDGDRVRPLPGVATMADLLSRPLTWIRGACETVLAGQLSGLYHAGGPRPLSLYQIAQIVNRVGGYNPRHLMGCPRVAAGPMPPRAGDVSMDSSKLAAALGHEPFHAWPFDESLVPISRDWHFERPAGEPHGPDRLAEVLYRNPLRC